MGVLRVDNFAELEDAHAKIVAEIERVKEEVQGSADYRATVGEMSSKMVLEEFMDGEEQVVDLIFSEGECVYGAVTDNWPATRSFEPKFNETGSNSPSVLSAEQQNELIDLSIGVTEALGFSLGVFCVNAKYTSRGARLIEVNCRMGGMFVRDHNRLCWGVDLVEEHLLATVGIPCLPPKAETPLQCTGGVYPSVEATGVILNTNVLNDYLPSKRQDIVYMTPLVEPGDIALGPKDAVEFPTWLCGYMCTAPTVEEAIEKAQKINDDIVAKVTIEPYGADELGLDAAVSQNRQQSIDSIGSFAMSPTRQQSWAA
jgi:carnosine synthase